ncbi:MAG: isopeptide-forming domain-containing fimbrial protein, partial [Oscillospiraceae bacterium]|nr:isopeptide-forming domain-containing fimbrial protein [Oscillospiraceae bacterium]
MKTTKRIFALLMAIVLLAGMAVSAFAAEPAIPDGEKLTINTEKEHTYYIYQLLVGDPYNSVDFPDDPETDVLVDGQVFGLVDSLSNVKAGKHLLTEPKPNGSLPTDDDEKEEAVKDFIAAMIPDDVPLTPEQIGDTAYAWTNTDDTDTVYVLYGGNDGGEKSVRVDKGYYIIIDTLNDNVDHDGHGDTGDPADDDDYDRDTVSRYMVAVVGDTKVSPKKVTPDIDKKIVDTDSNEAFANSDGKADTAAIGDEIEFEITGKVPDMTGYKYYYYNVQDTLSDGLTLDTSSFEVYITRPDLKGEDMAVYGSGTTKATEYVLVNSDDADNDTAEKDIYYVYTGDDAKPYTFILAFENLMELADKTNPTGVIPGDVIHIRYKATVNKDALVGNLANTNEADLKFSNDPSDSNRKDEDDDTPGLPDDDVITGLTPKKKTYTFVTELTIFKTDENGLPLKGAQFTLSGVNINQLVIEDEEKFVLATVKKDDCAFTTAAEKAETGYDGEAQ